MASSSSTARAESPAPPAYEFPTHRLRVQQDSSKIPLVLVVCGSFSPITIMHLRMCEMASDWVRMVDDNYEVVAIYISPVSDAYKKMGLAESRHRIRMCELAIESSPNCIMVDPWEANQPEYVPTVQVLDHIKSEINEVRGGISDTEGHQRKAHVSLLAGADLMQTMSTPGLWAPEDLERILVDGIYVVERAGTDLEEAKANLSQFADIHVIPQGIPIDLSSTKVRLYLKKKMSVRYFVPDGVIDYITENGLYQPAKEDNVDGQTASNGNRSAGDAESISARAAAVFAA